MSLLRTTRGGKTVDYALTNGGALLGTAPGCQIVVADPGVAPKHCRIARSPQGGYVVTDLSGGAGTVVNGNKIKDHVLKDGDVLQVGAEKFVYTDKDQAPAAAAPAEKTAGGRRALPSRPPQSAPRVLQSARPAAPAATATRPAAAAARPAAKKLTAKPGSVARIHKDHSVFALPSTTKGRTIAISVSVGLVLLGGALFLVSMNTVNSEEVRKRAKEKIAELEKIPEADFQKRFQLTEEILSNADFQKYATGEMGPVAKLRDQLKVRVDLEKRADTVLRPFFEKYKSLKEGPPEDFKKEWLPQYEIVKVHIQNFEGTTFGPRLIEIRNELKTNLENVGPTWSEEIQKLIREVTQMIKLNNFSNGLVLVDKFGSMYGEKESTQMKGMLQEQRERLRASAKSYVEKLKGEAAAKPTKDEKRKHLEAGLPFVKGFPEVERLLERYIREYQ